MHTSHFILHTLHSTLRTLYSTLYTLHSTLYTSYFTLHSWHFTVHTLHSTLCTPHSTLHTFHPTLYTLHPTRHNPHLTLYTLHSPLKTPRSSHSTLGTPTPPTFHCLQCTGTVRGEKWKNLQDCSKTCFTKSVLRGCIRVRWFVFSSERTSKAGMAQDLSPPQNGWFNTNKIRPVGPLVPTV